MTIHMKELETKFSRFLEKVANTALWNCDAKVICPEQVIDYSGQAIGHGWTGKLPSHTTASDLLQHMVKSSVQDKNKVKLDLSNNCLHVAGSATVLDALPGQFPFITHVDLTNNHICIEGKSEEPDRLALSIKVLLARDEFVELDLSENTFPWKWYYSLNQVCLVHGTFRLSVTKIQTML